MPELRFYNAALTGARMGSNSKSSLEMYESINFGSSYYEIKFRSTDPSEIVQSGSLFAYDYGSYVIVTDTYSKNASGHTVMSLSDAYVRIDASNVAELNQGIKFLLFGNDTIKGNKFSDVLKGFSGNDKIIGNDGNDKISGGTGWDRLFGGAGRDILKGDRGKDELYGEAGNDTLLGGGSDDFLQAGGGRDTLNGGLGSDILDGGAGSDYLVGAAGKDQLNGRKGDDELTGGKGQDWFVFRSRDDGSDIVTDYNRRQDTIWILEKLEDTVSIERSDGSTKISYGSGGEVVLENVELSLDQIDIQYF